MIKKRKIKIKNTTWLIIGAICLGLCCIHFLFVYLTLQKTFPAFVVIDPKNMEIQISEYSTQGDRNKIYDDQIYDDYYSPEIIQHVLINTTHIKVHNDCSLYDDNNSSIGKTDYTYNISEDEWDALLKSFTYQAADFSDSSSKYHWVTADKPMKLYYNIHTKTAKAFCQKHHCRLVVKGVKKDSSGRSYIDVDVHF